MDKPRDKVFRRKVTFSDSITRIPKVYENGRKDVPRPRSRSVFTSSHANDDLPTRDIVRYEGQASRPLYVPKPITVKNYFSEEYNDAYTDDGYSGGTIISPQGIITMHLREYIRVDLSLDRAIRISNAKNGIVLALSASGSSSGLIHPNGRVYQYGSRVEIMANDNHGNNKFAKMWYKGVSFTSVQCALVYLVDSAGTRTTTDTFNDLTHDFTLNIFYEDSPYSYLDTPNTTHTTHLVNEAMNVLQATNCWMTEDGTTNWIINNVRISQTADGLVRVGRNSNKFSLRTSPTNGSASVSSPYMHCTGSMGQTRHLFVRRGERRMHYDGSTFIVRNAGHSAGFDEKHQLKVY
ncbi:uncharacterized protein LOC114326201 isoform X1 [Diabrotica virgifera virgifera]|uniref:Uncharacterized protein LOC114326201 isoform X2 n=1 Tax=Diabrotica virgifera virgifera TaxID=50390 RepID=A0A6P7F4D1_DIAVI|nr:uncharacterized protein LOC114326201 isoform X1 [Diabrotica virgifera virgifera]